MMKFGLVKDELQQKRLPELKSMAQKHLLSKEIQLVESFQRKIDEVTELLPPEIMNFFSLPQVPEVVPEVVGKPERDKIEKESGILTLENEILTFLEQGLRQHEVDDNETFALMSIIFKRVIAKDNGSLCLQLQLFSEIKRLHTWKVNKNAPNSGCHFLMAWSVLNLASLMSFNTLQC